MAKKIKVCLCVLLSLAVLISCATVLASAGGVDGIYTVASLDEAAELLKTQANDDYSADCDGNCGHSPVIIVPGIMQSQVYVQDENGNDLLTVDGFPIVEGMDMQFMLDTKLLMQKLPSLILPLLKSLILNDRDFVFDAAVDLLGSSFDSHFFNPDGTRKNAVAVDEYWYSLEVCKTKPEKSYNYAKGYKTDENGNTIPTTKYVTEFDFIQRQVDISSFYEVAGLDHTYYYAYSSFGDTFTIAEKLNEYVQMVKQQTHHDKVNIVFISLGGTIGNVYLSEFCNPNDLDRVVYAAAAIDGSALLGDMMGGNYSFDDNHAVFNEIVPSIMQFADGNYKWAGGLANVVLRIIPEKVFNDLAMDLMQRATEKVLQYLLRNCPSMWALVPSEMYPTLAEKYLSDEAHAPLKIKTDAYYEIQSNMSEKLKQYTADGMDIFIVCGYNLQLPAIVDSYTFSSDTIIHSESESAGAVFAPLGGTLGEDYQPVIDASYISPDNTVDAGAGALPNKTWYVKNQSHIKLQNSVNDVIELCIQLALDKTITDSRVNNGGYAQFTEYRNLEKIEAMLRIYNEMTDEELSALGDENKAKLESAVADTLAIYNSRTWSAEEALQTEEALYKVMYELELLDKDDYLPPYVQYSLVPFANKFFYVLSNGVSKYYGDKDIYSWYK